MTPIASYLPYGIEALPVALDVRLSEPGEPLREDARRALRAIVSSGFRPSGPFRVSVREAGQVGRARSSRIKVSQYSLAPAELMVNRLCNRSRACC